MYALFLMAILQTSYYYMYSHILKLSLYGFNYSGRTQSMKIDDRKSNRSIDANRCMLVNWHRLVSANR